VVWAGDWPTDPGDEEILDRAHQEARVLVTLDKDFGELAIVRGLPHGGLIRLVDLSTSEQARISIAVLAKYGRELEAGAIITVEAARVPCDLPPAPLRAAQTEKAVDSGRDGVARTPSALRPF